MGDGDLAGEGGANWASLTAQAVCNLQVKPYNVYVTVAYPPDTDTPGLAEENKTKVSVCVWFPGGVPHGSPRLMFPPLQRISSLDRALRVCRVWRAAPGSLGLPEVLQANLPS